MDILIQAFLNKFVEHKQYKKLSEISQHYTVEASTDFLTRMFNYHAEPMNWTADNAVEALLYIANNKVGSRSFFKSLVPVTINMCAFLEEQGSINPDEAIIETIKQNKEEIWRQAISPHNWSAEKTNLVKKQAAERQLEGTPSSDFYGLHLEDINEPMFHHFNTLTKLFTTIELDDPLGNDLLLLKDIMSFRENLSPENLSLYDTLLNSLEERVLQGYSYRQIFAFNHGELPFLMELYLLGDDLGIMPAKPTIPEGLFKNYEQFNEKLNTLTLWDLSWLYVSLASFAISGSKTTVALSDKPYHAPTKLGRNDLCSCGSGKKYKKCCGK